MGEKIPESLFENMENGMINAEDREVPAGSFFGENGKHGIKSPKGEILVPAQFDDFYGSLYLINETSLIAAEKNQKWGLIKTDGSGTALSGFDYDYMSPISGPRVAVKKNDKWGYMNLQGKMETELDLDLIYVEDTGVVFMNGFSLFKKDGRIGVTDGYNFSKPVFDYVEYIEDSFVKVTKDGKEGFINEEGDFTENEEEARWIVSI